MSSLQAVAMVIGILVAVAAFAVIAFGWFRGATREAEVQRLRGENVDVVRRLEFLEPKLHESDEKVGLLEEKCALLEAFHNPTQQIADFAASESAAHKQINMALAAVRTDLTDVGAELAAIKRVLQDRLPRGGQ